MSDAGIHTVEVTSPDELDMESKAKEVTDILQSTYPGHVWMVGWAPGNTLIVKHMLLSALFGQYGFTIDAAKSYSSSHLKKLAVTAGGELLERCGLSRGRWDGTVPWQMDGTDPRHHDHMLILSMFREGLVH